MDSSSKVREFIVENSLFGDGEVLKEDTSLMEEALYYDIPEALLRGRFTRQIWQTVSQIRESSRF